MPWIPGVPIEALPFMGGATRPLDAVVCHRTIGNWAGDKAVLSRGRVPSTGILIGKAEGQWVQWYPTERLTNHAAGANGWAYGIEVSGQNGEPFTDWQVRAIRHVMANLPVPVARYTGAARVSYWRGYIDHAKIQSSLAHGDVWTDENWAQLGAPAPAPPPDSLDDMTPEQARKLDELHSAVFNNKYGVAIQPLVVETVQKVRQIHSAIFDGDFSVKRLVEDTWVRIFKKLG